MALRSTCLVALGLLVAGPALARESLIDGEPLQYNRQYHCNGQRIIVSRCGSTQDSGYCQVYYYPDDPNDNRMLSQPVEMRGDVIAKLAACATQHPPAATRMPNAKPAPASVSGRQAVSPVAPPGLGRASWHVVDSSDEAAIFFSGTWTQDRRKVSRGWFTYVFSKPQNYPDIKLTGVRFTQAFYVTDCSAGRMALVQLDRFGEDLERLHEVAIPQPQFDHPESGTIGGALLNIMCGQPQKLAADDAIVGDGYELKELYLDMLDERRIAARKH